MKQIRTLALILLAIGSSTVAHSQPAEQRVAGFYGLLKPRDIVFKQLDGSQYLSKNYGLSWRRILIGNDTSISNFDRLQPPRAIIYTDMSGVRYISEDGGLTFWLYPTLQQSSVKSRPLVERREAKVFPNPSSQTVMLTISASPGTVSVSLFDAQGSEVLKKYEAQKQSGEKSILLDVSHLSAGTYFYQVISGSDRYSSTLTIRR